MRKKLFLSGYVFALVFFCLLTNPAMGIGTYDGNWGGTNNQGHALSFEVTNDVVTSFEAKYIVYGTRCSATTTRTFQGNYSITGNSFTISGRDYDAMCPGYNDYNFTVTFSNSSTGSGTWMAENCYCGGATNGNFSVTSSGSPIVPDIAVSPGSFLEFAFIGSPKTKALTISNEGTSDLIIDDLTISGTDAAKFSIQNDNCSGQTLSPAGTCTVDVTATPTASVNLTATIEIPSNDPDTPTLDLPCTVLVPGAKESTISSQSFSGGLPGSGWTYFSSNAKGRIQVVDGRLRMDVTEDTNFALNEAVFSLNLAGRKHVRLYFFQAEFGDELDALPVDPFTGHSDGDGVAISNDGNTWYTIMNAGDLDVGAAGQIFDIDLDSAVAEIRSKHDPSFSYSSDFRIKFQQYDNYSYDLDGREWDIVLITERQMPAVLPCIPILLLNN